MNLQEKIQQRQNSKFMLECQFSAKLFFNAAEYFFIAAFIISLVSALLVFVPEVQNEKINIILYIIPSALDIIAWAYCYKANKCVKSAALLRNYFDETILGLKISNYTEDVKREIKSLVSKSIEKNQTAYRIQISNTGRDNPPGVKDWYEFSQNYSDENVVFECQRQNQWWNKKMSKMRIFVHIIILVVLVGLFIIFHRILRTPALKIIICLVGLIVAIMDRVVENYKYFKLSTEIDGSFKVLETTRNKKQIQELQKMIQDRREIPVLEINLFHEKKSKVLSEKYESISRNI